MNISALVDFHQKHNSLGTVTAVFPPSRFGELTLDGDTVTEFVEKPQMAKGRINGGFFVFNKKVLSYLTADEGCDFEFGPLHQIAKEKKLKAFMHDGFWQCMDNVRERNYLDKLVREKKAPWENMGQ